MDLASAGRRAAGRALPLRRRRPRLPLARRPRAPPQRASWRRSATARRRCRSRCACRSPRPGAPGAGRRRGGRRQAHGPPLHRRRDAARGDRRARGPVAQGRGDERRPARRGDHHHRRGRPLRGALRARRSTAWSRSTASCPSAPRSRPTAPGASRARTCRSRSPPSRRCCAPTRPSSASATPRCACASCCAARASSTRTCTSTWSPSTRARRSPTSCSSCCPRTSSATARRPGSCCRPTCATAPSCASGSSTWAQATPRGYPLLVRLVKGAYWDHEIVEARQHGWQSPVFEVKADSDRNFEALTRRLLEARPAVRVAIASHNLRSIAHAVAVNRALGAADSRPRDPGPARPGRRPAGGPGRARPAGAHVLPGRRPGRRHGLPRAPPAGEHEQRVLPARAGGRPFARRPAGGAMTDLPTFVNEPIGELRRSSVRDELLAGMAALEPTLPLRVPVWIGDGERHDDALQSTDPGQPERVVATTARATEAEVDEAVTTAAARLHALVGDPCRQARGDPRRRGGLDARAARRAGGAGGARVRQAVGRGRRRRLRGDRLPRVLRPRRRGAGSRQGAVPGARRAQRAALRPARRGGGHLAVELPASRSRWA